MLSSGGAQEYDEHSAPSGSQSDATNARFQLDTVTHVISLSVDFPEYQHCREPTLLEQASTSKGPLAVTVSAISKQDQLVHSSDGRVEADNRWHPHSLSSHAIRALGSSVHRRHSILGSLPMPFPPYSHNGSVGVSSLVSGSRKIGSRAEAT